MKNIKDFSNLIIGIGADETIINSNDNYYEVLQQLRKNEDELHLMTAGNFVVKDNLIGKHYRKLLEKKLTENNLEFNSVQYCSEKFSNRDKLLSCKKLHVDVMIDDKADVAMYLAENGVMVILMDGPDNKEAVHNNIVRVNNWSEVNEEVDKLRFEKKQDNNNSEFSKLDYKELESMSENEKREYYNNYYRYLKKESLKLDTKDLDKGKKAYRLIYRLLSPIIKLVYKPITEQKENIPYQGGKIICSNHVRLSDYYLIYLGLGLEQYGAGFMKAEIKNSIGGKFFSSMRSAAFIDRDDPESRRRTAEGLAVRNVYGDNIIVFPEGTRKDKTEEGKNKTILPFNKGAVAMAKKTGTGILPMAIYYGKRTRMKYGEIFYVSPTDDISEYTDKLQGIIKNMVEEMREQEEKKKISR